MTKKPNTLRVLLVGGGTGGPTAPLLAVAEQLRELNVSTEFLFIGGYKGPEQHMAAQTHLAFVRVPAGKFHRYMTIRTLGTPFLVVAGFIKSLFLISRFKPTVAVGAGSYIQVPVLWAAWLLRVPILIHQQDIHPTLANSLCASIAKKITVTFQKSAKDFSEGLGLRVAEQQSKIVYTGNPVRKFIASGTRDEAIKFFKLKPDKPTLLVLGGGTGAESINKLITENLPAFTNVVQIIHGTGKGKTSAMSRNEDYHPLEFIDRMDLAYAMADIVIARAGLSTITELSKLNKISIIIPIPNTHQEQNARELADRDAAIVLDQQETNAGVLLQFIRNLMLDRETQQTLQHNIAALMPGDATEHVSKEIISIAKH